MVFLVLGVIIMIVKGLFFMCELYFLILIKCGLGFCGIKDVKGLLFDVIFNFRFFFWRFDGFLRVVVSFFRFLGMCILGMFRR